MDPYDLSKRAAGGYQPEPTSTTPSPPQGGSGSVPLLDLEFKKPDRAARIRARAERFIEIGLSARSGFAEALIDDHKQVFLGAHVLARLEVDELDRLEREEREKGEGDE